MLESFFIIPSTIRIGDQTINCMIHLFGSHAMFHLTVGDSIQFFITLVSQRTCTPCFVY